MKSNSEMAVNLVSSTLETALAEALSCGTVCNDSNKKSSKAIAIFSLVDCV